MSRVADYENYLVRKKSEFDALARNHRNITIIDKSGGLFTRLVGQGQHITVVAEFAAMRGEPDSVTLNPLHGLQALSFSRDGRSDILLSGVLDHFHGRLNESARDGFWVRQEREITSAAIAYLGCNGEALTPGGVADVLHDPALMEIAVDHHSGWTGRVLRIPDHEHSFLIGLLGAQMALRDYAVGSYLHDVGHTASGQLVLDSSHPASAHPIVAFVCEGQDWPIAERHIALQRWSLSCAGHRSVLLTVEAEAPGIEQTTSQMLVEAEPTKPQRISVLSGWRRA